MEQSRTWATCRRKWKELQAQRPKGRRLSCPACKSLIVFGDGETRVQFWHDPPHCESFREVIAVLVEMGERIDPDIDRAALIDALETVDTRHVERLKQKAST